MPSETVEVDTIQPAYQPGVGNCTSFTLIPLPWHRNHCPTFLYHEFTFTTYSSWVKVFDFLRDQRNINGKGKGTEGEELTSREDRALLAHNMQSEHLERPELSMPKQPKLKALPRLAVSTVQGDTVITWCAAQGARCSRRRCPEV